VTRLTPGEAVAALATLRNFAAGALTLLRKANTEFLAPRRAARAPASNVGPAPNS